MTIPALSSHIDTVTVFRNGAFVTRVGEIKSSSSSIPEQVRLSGLPLSLEDGSVTVRIESVGGGTAPEACDVRVGLDVPEPDPSLAPPKDEELRAARGAVSTLEDQLEQHGEMVTRLHTLSAPERPQGARGEVPPPAPTAARLELLEFRQSELERLGEKRRSLQSELEKARDELQILEHRHQTTSTSRQAREHELRKSIIVRLRHVGNDPIAPTCRLIAEYLVPGARWVPNYAVRVSEGQESADLVMRALVCQASGEDWEDVKLNVATANPQRWSELPELPALRIGRRQPTPPRTGWRELPSGAEELFADYDRVSETMPPRELGTPATSEWDELSAGSISEQDFDTMDELACPEDEDQVFAKEFKADLGPMAMAAAPADMMNYGKLRLAGTGDSDRGTLRALDIEESYFEFLTSIHVSVDIDVRLAVKHAYGRAVLVQEREPPHGHFTPESWEGFDHSYSAETRVSVPSDANFHNVPLLKRSGSIDLTYVTVPRETLEVFRFLTFTNPLQAPIPEGPADVYVDGDYLLTSQLHTVAPGGTVELGLGAEEAVKVARNTRFSERTSGILGGNLGLQHEITIDVTNNIAKTVKIEIRERVPIAREGDDEVSVEVTAVDPPWKPYDQDRRQIEGAYCWRIEVPQGGTKTMNLCYEISLSAKHEIVGGNRREE